MTIYRNTFVLQVLRLSFSTEPAMLPGTNYGIFNTRTPVLKHETRLPKRKGLGKQNFEGVKGWGNEKQGLGNKRLLSFSKHDK